MSQRRFFHWTVFFIAGLIFIAGTFLLANFTQAETEAGATEVCGTISTDTTWTAANSPYVVTCEINVVSGASLTLEAGTVVKVTRACQ